MSKKLHIMQYNFELFLYNKVSESSICENLKKRFMDDWIFTYIGNKSYFNFTSVEKNCWRLPFTLIKREKESWKPQNYPSKKKKSSEISCSEELDILPRG
jgi:hypothetical protein